MNLSKTEEHWNNNTLNYNLEKFNWPKWALSVIQEIAPEVTELETMHETVNSIPRIVEIQKHVQNACSRRDFMERFDAFAEEVVPQRIDNKKYLIQRQGTLRVVIPNQAKVSRRLHFHQGIFVGNGRGCRTIWTPLTEAKDTNTMWIMDLDKSRELTKLILEENWPLEKIEEESMKYSFPVNLKPGQSHLFLQEMIHGNVNNEENYTRCAIDMRILVEGEEYGRRYPGGFMRLPGDYGVTDTTDYSDHQIVTYAGWSSKFSKNLPLPMQRQTIENYCTKHNIKYNSYEFENEYCDWQPSLEYLIKNNTDGIVLSSIYALTDDAERRNELLQLALDNNVILHFANETFSLKNTDDLEKINTYLNFAVQYSGKNSWEM